MLDMSLIRPREVSGSASLTFVVVGLGGVTQITVADLLGVHEEVVLLLVQHILY